MSVIYCVAESILPGPMEGSREEQAEWSIGNMDYASFRSPLTHLEAKFLIRGRLVTSSTCSMQQYDFERMGFKVNNRVVEIPPGFEVVGIGTEDRYAIFEPGTNVTSYRSLGQWRYSGHHPLSARSVGDGEKEARNV